MRGFAVLLLAALAGCDHLAQNQMDDINKQVVKDAEEQYRIASESGSPIDKCVHAGLVSAAYIQAKDQDGYRGAKVIENLDCANAGLPR